MQKILVVDDDPHIREVVCFALQQADFETITAEDGERALAIHQAGLELYFGATAGALKAIDGSRFVADRILS